MAALTWKVLIACLCLSVSLAHAQERKPLAELKRIQLSINITGTPDAASTCGITDKLIRDAFMHPASSAKFSIVNDKPQAAFLITVYVLHSPPGICATHVKSTLLYRGTVPLDFSGRTDVLPVMLWDLYRAGISGSNAHTDMVRKITEDSAKAFVTEWNLQNK
jgi:hypothetical protein